MEKCRGLKKHTNPVFILSFRLSNQNISKIQDASGLFLDLRKKQLTVWTSMEFCMYIDGYQGIKVFLHEKCIEGERSSSTGNWEYPNQKDEV